MTDLNAPIDQIHRDSVRATEVIGEDAAVIRQRIASWQPRPAPRQQLPKVCPNCLTRFGSYALLSEHARFGTCRREVTP